MCYGLLVHEIGVCDKHIANAAPDEKEGFQGMKEALEGRLELLELSISLGTIDQASYETQTKEALQHESSRAILLKQKGQTQEYQAAIERVKAMKKELDG